MIIKSSAPDTTRGRRAEKEFGQESKASIKFSNEEDLLVIILIQP